MERDEIHEQEVQTSTHIITNLLARWLSKNANRPEKIWVSDNDELQSIIMFVAPLFGLKYGRTQKQTYIE
tara:strand:+ start:242 stop:451 length:210 start_codon:yes stop_codon:yes gene_type:complete